jgi:hypothetical protein
MRFVELACTTAVWRQGKTCAHQFIAKQPQFIAKQPQFIATTSIYCQFIAKQPAAAPHVPYKLC